jgi:hypothetical protein
MSYTGEMTKQTRPGKIYLHHSGNDIDTVAGIVAYHKSKWLDVGYNWLIKDGKVFAGRPMLFTGAHTKGGNSGSIGICMVGNYDLKLPSEDSITALVRIMAEQCFMFHIDERNILGHRDKNPTDCPGEMLYNFIPELRVLVKNKKEIDFDVQVTKP